MKPKSIETLSNIPVEAPFDDFDENRRFFELTSPAKDRRFRELRTFWQKRILCSTWWFARASTLSFFLFISFFASMRAHATSLTIPLHTATSSQAVYVGDVQATCSDLSPSYLATLRDVLLFDLNHNGATYVQPQNEEAEYRLKGHGCFAPLFWKNRQSSFVLRPTVEKHTLSIDCLTVHTGVKTSFSSRLLSGELAHDRHIIHQIADHVCKEITGTYGIAATKILYAVKVPKPGKESRQFASEIWEIDYDGEGKKQLTAEGTYCISPCSFPVQGPFTRSRFLYVNYRQGPSKIYTARFSDTQGVPLISLRGNQLLPTLSPQGHLIAFISDASGRADLFIQPMSLRHGPSGKPIQVYSFPRSVQSSPTFSPDGKQIAFVSDRDGSPRIYLIDTPYPRRKLPVKLTCLTTKHRQNMNPCWSPDGTKLAYSAKIDGVRQIMVYDFTTKEEIQLTDGNCHKENPSFAPNSLHLVFHAVNSSSELFVINLKQRKAHQITRGSGDCHYPHWSARDTKMRLK